MLVTQLTWNNVFDVLRQHEDSIVVMSPVDKTLHGINHNEPVIWLSEKKTCMAADHSTTILSAAALMEAVRAKFLEKNQNLDRPAWGRYNGSYLKIIEVRSSQEASQGLDGLEGHEPWLVLHSMQIGATSTFKPTKAGEPRPGLIPKH